MLLVPPAPLLLWKVKMSAVTSLYGRVSQAHTHTPHKKSYQAKEGETPVWASLDIHLSQFIWSETLSLQKASSDL